MKCAIAFSVLILSGGVADAAPPAGSVSRYGPPQRSQTEGLYVEDVNVLFLESFPVQVHVIARGHLANPCMKISRVLQERRGNTFYITLTVQRTAQGCIQVLEPFEERVALDTRDLPSGNYRVDVNGRVDTFGLDAENALPPSTDYYDKKSQPSVKQQDE
ncbi:MAG: hypothetical protein Q8Q08_08175 [Candidatus Omnitrophota bacterium]|nr:hypothetical protein [Candidatus Omnitrophota bacterium]MDZ4242060.1 hypothetical protein [Candidatus Omnitrophota bacterium]